MKTLLLFILAYAYGDQDFNEANRWFSASLYKKSAKQTTGNFLVSPLSAQTILALTQSGCSGPTAQEIRSVLNLGIHPEKVESVFANLLPSLSESKHYTLHSANKVYVKSDFHVKPFFQNLARQVYKADCENIDFTRREEAAQIMNSWVEGRTNHKIPNLVDPHSLNDRSRAILLNSLYFKANWSTPFLRAYTMRLPFNISKNEELEVDMMVLHEKRYNYYENPKLGARFLELPFKGKEASMVIVLPDKVDGLGDLEMVMKKVLKNYRLSEAIVNLGVPRFRVETKVNLKNVLKKMGVEKIFDKQYADLSQIAGEKGDLVVDDVSQKSFIEVSEDGVEAATAAYMLIAIPMSAPVRNPVTFRVDRPFIFYIKIKGVIAFVGRVVNPTV